MKKLLKEWKSFLKESRANTEQLRAELGPKFPQYAQVILDSIKNKQYYIMAFEVGGGRPIVILDTQKGLLPFYRSTGTSEQSKEDGEWTLTGGYQCSRSRNYGLLSKNVRSFGLTQGNDRYLSTIALVLEYMWDNRIIQENCQPVFLNKISKRRNEQVNNKIKELNLEEEKYMFYDDDNLQGAYLNTYLDEMGVLDNTYLTGLFTDTHEHYIGLEEIMSEKLTTFETPNKFLPKLEDVVN